MSTDFTGMIAFAQSLAETVKQAQTATEALAAREIDYAALKHDYETVCADRNDWRNDAQSNADHIVALKAELAASEVRNREVSEALARANAKLDSFRQLLGVDGGTSAPVPTPAVLPEQSTHTIAEPPHEAQPVDPAVAPGTRGVEQDHAAPVGFDSDMQRALEEDGAKLRALTGEDHGPHFQSEPTPAPEVAEPRPTSASTDPSSSGVGQEGSLSSSDDRFGQAQEAAPSRPFTTDLSGGTGESWRDSASHVAYRPFSYGG